MNVNLKYTPKSTHIAKIEAGQYFETSDGGLYKYLVNDVVINLDTMQTTKLTNLNKNENCQVVDINLQVEHTCGVVRLMDISYERYFEYRGDIYKHVRFVGALRIKDMSVHELSNTAKVRPVAMEEINITVSDRNVPINDFIHPYFNSDEIQIMDCAEKGTLTEEMIEKVQNEN